MASDVDLEMGTTESYGSLRVNSPKNEDQSWIFGGLEPKVLSLSAAVGLTIGLFPICGVAMILCALSAVVLRSKCHVPTLMLGNLVASIFELGLLVPFIRVGELVTRGDHFIITSTGLWEALTGRSEPTHELVFGMLHAVLGWSIVAPFSIVILFVGFLPMFHYLTVRFGPQKLVSHQASGCCDAASEAGEPTSNAYPTIINFAETKN